MCRFHRHEGGVAVQTNPYRLSRNVLPEHYDLRLVPDLQKGTYEGEVTITVKVSEPTNEIALNVISFEDDEHTIPNIVIHGATITSRNGTEFKGNLVLDPANERVHVKVNGLIGAGDWRLTMPFSGKLNDMLKGFYRSTYKDEQGREQVIATTQFESTDARRAFPCFDEPNMKATFKVTMEIPEKYAAISNTAIERETIVPGSRMMHEENAGNNFFSSEIHGTGRKVVEFRKTMKMPTYILAFIVGDLVKTKPVLVDGVELAAWAVPGKEHLTKFALKIGAFSLRYFRRYFGVAYAGDKLDLLAIPDFNAGAMENMGAATFRESALLVDEANASQSALDYVAEVVAHEIAHMWFGNLVTMDWWTGLWLNEAFATYMSYKCVEAWKPAWGVWDKFGLSRAAAFRTDGLKTTRPIEFPAISPADAEGMFDVLTYEKGCSVMRMLEMFMGEETFRNGIALYIKRHAYGNTEGMHLWNALGEASGIDVSTMMHGWLYTPGFPIVAVSSTGAGAISLKQSQFKYLADGVNPDQRWHVPVMLRAKTAEGVIEMKHLLTQAEETVYLGEGVEWVVVNAGGHGFYRVDYADDLAEKLTATAQQTLTVIERVNLLGDEWACVQAGQGNATEFLKLVKQFGDEQDPNVWAFITSPLSSLRHMLPADKRGNFEAMVRELIAPAVARLGWESKDGEPAQLSELRGSLVAALAITGNDAEAKAKAHDLFAAWKSDNSTLAGDMLKAVVAIVAKTGDEELYDEFFQLFKDAKSPEHEDNFRDALASFQHGELCERTLSICLDPKQIRTQDAPYVVAATVRHEAHGEKAWQFVKDNWAKFEAIYTSSGLVKIANSVTALATPEYEADASAFFEANPIKGYEKMIAQALELQRINRLAREREAAALLAAYA